MSALDAELTALLTEWLPPDAAARPLMQLATVGPDGHPDVRSVLLSEWDEDGFFFHTDSRSRKATQLAGNPWVALALVAPDQRRQLIVRGPAGPAVEAELHRAYANRIPYLRQLAWQNTDELAQLGDAERQRIWAEFGAGGDLDHLEPPSTWTGFLVRPSSLTFWQADSLAPSRRTEYTRTDRGGWSHRLLAG